jgi:hypothetical protein
MTDKAVKDDEYRKKKIQALSLDEYTATKFLNENATVSQAASELLQHLEALHSAASC